MRLFLHTYRIILLIPSTLAVFPIITTVLFLKKTKNLMKKVRWWHILWAVYFLSGLTFRIRATENVLENPFDAAGLLRMLLVSITGLGLLAWLAKRRNLGINHMFGGLIGILAVYALVGATSTLWSVYPLWTLYKSLEYLVGVALIGAIVANIKFDSRLYKSLFDWNWLLVGLLLLTVWLGVLLAPGEAIRRGVGILGIQIEGVFPKVAANGVGDLGATLGIIALVRFTFARGASRWFYSSLLAVSLPTLTFSQSRSPLIGFGLATALILFLHSKKSRLLLLFSIPFLCAAVFLTPLGNYLWEFLRRNQSDELFLSLSGRVYWWEAAWPYIKENFFFGSGAYAGGRFLVAAEFSDTLSSLHGTWPEVLIGTGLLGLTPLVAAVAGAWIALIRSYRGCPDALCKQLCLEAIGIMMLLSVRSVFSVSFIWHPALTWLLVLGYAEVQRRRRYARPMSSHLLSRSRW